MCVHTGEMCIRLSIRRRYYIWKFRALFHQRACLHLALPMCVCVYQWGRICMYAHMWTHTYVSVYVCLCVCMWMSSLLASHLILLIFLISKSRPCSSSHCDGQFPVGKCHQSPLPLSPLSAPCCPFWHPPGPSLPFHWRGAAVIRLHTHTQLYMCAQIHTDTKKDSHAEAYKWHRLFIIDDKDL